MRSRDRNGGAGMRDGRYSRDLRLLKRHFPGRRGRLHGAVNGRWLIKIEV